MCKAQIDIKKHEKTLKKEKKWGEGVPCPDWRAKGRGGGRGTNSSVPMFMTARSRRVRASISFSQGDQESCQS